MNLVQAFVNNPVKISVGVLLVGLFGAIALMRMPMQLTPEVQTPTITITTRWPGASPMEVEREIIYEQEEQLKGVEGVTKMTGTCSDSSGELVLEFAVGTDMASALLKVNSRLQQVPEYPEDSDEPVITTASSNDQPIGWFILRPRVVSPEGIAEFRRAHPGLDGALERAERAHNSGLRLQRLIAAAKEYPEIEALLPESLDISTYRTFAEDYIESRFERVPGVSNANVFGGRKEELQIIVDPQRLAARGLTIADVRTALDNRNRDTSAGDFWEGKRRYIVRTMGQLESPEEVADVIVARRDDIPVYIRDVAEVRRGFKKPTGLVRNFGAEAIAINAVRDSGSNVLEIMDGLREAIVELNEGVLADRDLQLEQVYDETDYIYSSIGLLRSNLVIGGCLTIVVLLLFLRSARSTLVIALAIPTSIIGTFLLLDLMGRSLNVISLAGLAFAVGMLVDNAVVVLENIYRHFQQGESRTVAAIKGTQEVWGAVVASTLTTLAVFLPVLFIEEEAGQLFRDIALAVSCSVGLSLIVSVTVIPTATMRLLPRRHGEKQFQPPAILRILGKPFNAVGSRFVDHIVGLNRWLQGGVVRQIVLIVGLVGGAALLTWALFPKVEYLPAGNQNLVFGFLIPPPGYNVDEMKLMGDVIEEGLRPYWDVDPGDPAIAQLEYPAIQDFFFVAFGQFVILGMRAQDPLEAGRLVPLAQRTFFSIPGTFGFAQQASLFERGLNQGRTIDVELTGPDLRQLVGLGRQVMMKVRELLPGAQAIPRPSLDLSNPEVHVLPKWEKAKDMGISAVGLGYTVNSLVDGAYAGDFHGGGHKIDLTIVGQKRFAGRVRDLEELIVATPLGDLVPLRAIADIALASGPQQIVRRERERAITIRVSPAQTQALEDAMEKISTGILAPLHEQGQLGGGYKARLAGTADKLRATWEALSFNVILALLITYLLMAALFESWLYPFVIILSVPLGAAGGFLGLWLLNLHVQQSLDVLTMLGFVILIGTVVNNAILIVHQALNHMRNENLPSDEAVLRSVESRVRPIFMTLFTTVFGLSPLVLFPGAGSELYRGLGSILIGGLLVSTFFTLMLVPTLFQLALSVRSALGRALFGARA